MVRDSARGNAVNGGASPPNGGHKLLSSASANGGVLIVRADSRFAALELGRSGGRWNMWPPIGDEAPLRNEGHVSPGGSDTPRMSAFRSSVVSIDASPASLESAASMYLSTLLLADSGGRMRRGGGMGGGDGDDNTVNRAPLSNSVSSFNRSDLSDDRFGCVSSLLEPEAGSVLSSGGFDAERRPKRNRCQRSNVLRRFSMLVNCAKDKQRCNLLLLASSISWSRRVSCIQV